MKLLKKIFVTSLVLSLFATSIPSTASATTTNSKNITKLNKEQKELLQEQNINLVDIEIIDKNLAFSEETLKKMDLEEQELKANGLVLETEVYYKYKTSNDNKMSDMQLASMAPDYDMIILSSRVYTTVSQKADGVTPMSYLADTVFNLTIGIYTKYAWRVATLFGISPSMFMTTTYTGDFLQETGRYIYSDRTYCYYDNSGVWWPLLRTSKLDLTLYVDIYTKTYSGQDYRDSKSTNTVAYSAHYSDYSWIHYECAANRLYNGSAVTYDLIY